MTNTNNHTPPDQLITTKLLNYYTPHLMHIEANPHTQRLTHTHIGIYPITLTKAVSEFAMINRIKSIHQTISCVRNVSIYRKGGDIPNRQFSLILNYDTLTLQKGELSKLELDTIPKGQILEIIINHYDVTLAIPGYSNNGTKQGKQIIGTYPINLTRGATNVELIAHLKRLHPSLLAYRNISIYKKPRKSVTMKLDFDKVIKDTLLQEQI